MNTTQTATEPKRITDSKEAIAILADEAERQGADANDTNGTVRAIVTTHGLGFNAWFCVCCELADRAARRQGFKNEVDRAFMAAKQTIEAKRAAISNAEVN